MKNFLDQDFVILGGGITGCSLAWLLKLSGARRITLLEKEKECGGVGRTHYLNGLPYEFGPHILHAKKSATINFYKKIGVRAVDYYTKMVFDNDVKKLVDFPFSEDSLAQLPADLAQQVKKELSQLNREKIDFTNLETYLKSVYGPTLYRQFNYGYSKKFWGRDPVDVPSNGLAGWINFRTNDKRVFMEWQGYPNKDLNDLFALTTQGIKIVQANVKGIGKSHNNRIESILTDKGQIDGDYFISTLPPENLFPETGHRLEYIGKTIVFIHADGGPYLPQGIGGIYFPDKGRLNRIVEYPSINNVSYPRLPQGTLLGVEYPFINGISSTNWDEYADDAVQCVKKNWNCAVKGVETRSHASIYPVRSDEQLSIFQNVFSQKAESFENLKMTGRYGSFIYVNMNNCFEMALSVVAGILKKDIKDLTTEVGLDEDINVHSRL